MAESPPPATLRLGTGRSRVETPFDLTLDDLDGPALVRELDLLALRKLRFRGALRPRGTDDWELEATLGATVVQACGVTLAPVTTRIDEPVARRYVAALKGAEQPIEQEIPEDDTEEPLPARVDLRAVLIEALSLALPPFPRAPDAGAGGISLAPPGVAPIGDGEANPFAGLRDALKGGD